jgi:hypothetical protein
MTAGDAAHAITSGRFTEALTTGAAAFAITTAWRGHAETKGDRSFAITTLGGSAKTSGRHAHAIAVDGESDATGDHSHAITTGDKHAAGVAGKNAIACGLGPNNYARASEGGWIILVAYDDQENITAIRTAKVGENGIKPNHPYVLNKAGQFELVPTTKITVFRKRSRKPPPNVAQRVLRRIRHLFSRQ